MDFYTPRDEEDEETEDGNLISGTTSNEPLAANIRSSYLGPTAMKTPAPAERKVSGQKESGPGTPVTDAMRTGTPGSSKRKAAENAMNKLHNEIMPDVIAWQKEKHRKRIPEEPRKEDEKRKAEKRKTEEKENLETIAKKPRKEVDTVAESGSKITLLITGASDDLTSFNAIKVDLAYILYLILETVSTGYTTNV